MSSAGSRSTKRCIDTMIEKLQGMKGELLRKEIFSKIRQSKPGSAKAIQLCLPHLDKVEQLVQIKACGLPEKSDVAPVVIAAMQVQDYRLILEIEYCDRNASIQLHMQEAPEDSWQPVWSLQPWRGGTEVSQKLDGIKQLLDIDSDDPKLVVALLVLSGAAISPMCLYAALLALDPQGGEWTMLACQYFASDGETEAEEQVDDVAIVPQVAPELEWWEALNLSITPTAICQVCGCNCNRFGACLGECQEKTRKRSRS